MCVRRENIKLLFGGDKQRERERQGGREAERERASYHPRLDAPAKCPHRDHSSPDCAFLSPDTGSFCTVACNVYEQKVLVRRCVSRASRAA